MHGQDEDTFALGGRQQPIQSQPALEGVTVERPVSGGGGLEQRRESFLSASSMATAASLLPPDAPDGGEPQQQQQQTINSPQLQRPVPARANPMAFRASGRRLLDLIVLWPVPTPWPSALQAGAFSVLFRAPVCAARRGAGSLHLPCLRAAWDCAHSAIRRSRL